MIWLGTDKWGRNVFTDVFGTHGVVWWHEYSDAKCDHCARHIWVATTDTRLINQLNLLPVVPPYLRRCLWWKTHQASWSPAEQQAASRSTDADTEKHKHRIYVLVLSFCQNLTWYIQELKRRLQSMSSSIWVLGNRRFNPVGELREGARGARVPLVLGRCPTGAPPPISGRRFTFV